MDVSLVARADEMAVLGDALAARTSVVVAGASGVGKTRLAREAAWLARDRGWRVEGMAGSATARSLRFGAAARLLARTDARDPHELVTLTIARVRERAASRPLLLIVDDAQLLDPGSATLVQHLVLDGAAPCVLTVRTGEPCPDAIVALWKEGHARRVDVGPLGREETAALLAATLAGKPCAALEAEVWRITCGNPLFLRELVAAGRADGTLSEVEGRWVASGSLPTSTRMADVIDVRLRALDEGDRKAVERIAVGEPLRLPIAQQLVGSDRLERLEQQALLAVERDRGLVRAAHPMYGEVLRAVMPASRRASIASEVADVLTRSGATHAGEAMSVASLLLDAGRTPPPLLALEGARDALAVFDVALAERLAGAAADTERFEGHLLLGRALRLQKRGVEAERALGTAAAAGRDDEQIGQAALARARNALWVLGDLDGARAILERARERVHDQAWVAVLEVELALQLATVGDFATGRQVAARALERPGIAPRAELAALIVVTLGQALMLDVAGFDDEVARGLELAAELRAEEPLATDQLLLGRCQLLCYEDPERVARLAEERSQARSPLLGVWRMAAAMAALLTGDVTEAVAASRDAMVALDAVDPFGNLPMVRGLYGVALAQRGDLKRLRAHRSELTSAEVQREPRAQVWADRALTWEAAAAGDVERAVGLAVTGGAAALAHSNVGWGSDLLHDAVRLGAPEAVVDVLVDATGGTGVTLAELFGRNATALAGRDIGELEVVAESFAAAGALLLGAETFAQAARLHAARGAAGPAARVAVRAQLLTACCPGAATPALSGLADLGLSVRELEVAGLAAKGRSNRAIAAALVLSLRTVENHLSRAYHKLHLTGRSELQRLFVQPTQPTLGDHSIPRASPRRSPPTG